MSENRYPDEYGAILHTLQSYIDGSRQGKSTLMRSVFHPQAAFFGYVGEELAVGIEFLGSVEHVFRWITQNGPAPSISARFARIEIIETIAVVHLDVYGWTGKLVGAGARASDVFALLDCDGQWKITHKLFHWYYG